MSQELQRFRADTALGGLIWHGLAETPDESRPVLVVIPGVLMSIRAVNKLPGLMQDLCQVALAELPLQGDTRVANATLEQVAEALAAGVLAAFGSRPIVLAGFDDAALVAVGAGRLVSNLGAVAIEPPLSCEHLWPPRARLEELAKATAELRLRQFISEVYGVGDEFVSRRHHRYFEGLRRPVEVVVGERGLPPQPTEPPDASWVSGDDRAWLAATDNVSLHVAAGAGHELAREAGAQTLALLREAVTRAAGLSRDDDTAARQLALAAPLTARRVRYQGPTPAAFSDAYLARNPGAAMVDGACDLLVLHDVQAGEGAAALDAGGEVVATASYPQAAALARDLAGQGLTPVRADPYLAPFGSSLQRARKGPAEPVTPVAIFPFAQTLMEIRTRLPALALRTDAGLALSYGLPPAHIARLTPGPPRVLIAQRPGYWTPELWRNLAAAAIVDQTVFVMEYDDHPDLVSEMTRGGRPQDDWEWERFRLVHAIQTSTEALGELFRRYNPEVRVFPNAAFDIAPFPVGERKPRVFYGGVTRGPFAVAVAAALGPAVAARPDAEFLVVGDRAVFDALPTTRKRYVEYMNYASYLAAMVECSVSLSPLEDRPMIETKSDAKFIDASRAGVLTIASPVVYEGVIRSGENGLIARTMEDWGRQLTLALCDGPGRERMARAAWEEVRANRMFAAQIPERRAWYADLVARREAIGQGIMERSPELAAAVAVARARD